MNKKASTPMIGAIISVFVAAIVGVILLTASAQNIGEVKNTYAVENESTVSTNGTTGLIDTDCQAWSSITVYNGSDDITLSSGNYSVTNNYVYNGGQTVRFNVTTQPIYQGQPWNVSYTCTPLTYDNSSGGRSVAALIVVFFALAIATVALEPTLRNKVLKMTR